MSQLSPPLYGKSLVCWRHVPVIILHKDAARMAELTYRRTCTACDKIGRTFRSTLMLRQQMARIQRRG